MNAKLSNYIPTLCGFLGTAQDNSQQSPGIIKSARTRLDHVTSKQDSITGLVSPDTSKLPIDTLKIQTANLNAAKQRVDSVENLIKENKVTRTADSLEQLVTKPINQAVKKADDITNKTEQAVQKRMDSLEQRINKPLDKINSKVSSIEKPLEEKVEGVNKELDQKADKIEGEVRKGIDKATDGAVNTPPQNIEVPNVNLPKTPAISEVDLNNPSVPGGKGNLDNPTLPKSSVDVPKLNLDAGDLKEKTNVKIPDVSKLPDVKGEINDADAKLAELEKYEQELRGIKKLDSASIESATKRAEDRILNMEQMKGVKEQMKTAADKQAEYDALVQRYRDKKLTQQELTRKAKNLVNDKINKDVPEVKKGMDVINKSKSTVKGMLSKENNQMAGKPIGQRLIPGITLQSSKANVFVVDFGLQLGYRLTGRLRTGVGGIYRVGFDDSYKYFVKGQSIYGGRGYAEFLIRKGIYIHAEYELLEVPDNLSSPETRTIVSSGYFGIGKQFNISKKIKGHTLFLYRAEF
ncbi:MAG TPA: hypothetical protein VK589_28715 [Chryseolinea sp.]|nr:hypothetical protein [Chryseolinea sp.]